MVRWCLPVLFSLLETHDVVRLLGALLGECKVRGHGSNSVCRQRAWGWVSPMGSSVAWCMCLCVCVVCVCCLSGQVVVVGGSHDMDAVSSVVLSLVRLVYDSTPTHARA